MSLPCAALVLKSGAVAGTPGFAARAGQWSTASSRWEWRGGVVHHRLHPRGPEATTDIPARCDGVVEVLQALDGESDRQGRTELR